MMGIAAHDYHGRFGMFPNPKMDRILPGVPGPPSSVDLSWRVTILPFAEEQATFNRFDQAVAWDQGNNLPILQGMPKMYESLRGPPAEMTHTPYQYFTGPNTLFPVGAKRVRFNDITDGTANTFLIAEAQTPVAWTKPADMIVTPNAPLPLPVNDFLALFADGSVRRVDRSRNPDAILRLLIDPRDNQPVQLND
jgi:hypothetical protein